MRQAGLFVVLIMLAGAMLLTVNPGQLPASQPTDGHTPAVEQRVRASFFKLPLSFEPNHGQTDEQVVFLARGPGYTLFLTPTEAVLALRSSTKVADSTPSLSGSSGPSGRGAQHPQGNGPERQNPRDKPAVLQMKLVGANPAPAMEGINEQPGKSNYFIGNDPEKWRTNVPHYGKVQYREVYPGIDLVYYGSEQGQLEYDFIVAPGADPANIRMNFEGAEQIHIDENGDLVVHLADSRPSTPLGAGQLSVVSEPKASPALRDGQPSAFSELRFKKPRIYQPTEAVSETTGSTVAGATGLNAAGRGLGRRSPVGRRRVAGDFVLQDNLEVSFDIGPYDASQPLIIDPVLSYSTYLGGGSTDKGFAAAVDATGSAYVTGVTNSLDFPITSGAFDTDCGTDGTCNNPTGQGFTPEDVFVAKLNPTGSTLVYSTYLGGNFSDWGYGIVVDSSGSAHIAGVTGSTDFPTTAGAFQTTFGGCVTCSSPGDLFVAKLSADGSSLVYSTYLGGSRNEGRGFDPIIPGMPIAVDSSGNAYVANITKSPDFPTTAGVFDTTFDGFDDGFVTKINADGTALIYSTYLGGSGSDRANGIAVDVAGNAYVTGTGSSDFPTTSGAFQTTGGGAFVTKLNPAGSGLVYSTFLGGGEGFGIAADSNGNAYVTGVTESTDFPVANPFQAIHGGGFRDAFVAKLSASGSTLIYSSFLGGGGEDRGHAIMVDEQGAAYVTGQACCDFPVVNALPNMGGFSNHAFVSKVDMNGSMLIYSILIGGSTAEIGYGIALDAAGNTYVAGETKSTNFPTANPLQPTFAGVIDAFVTKICGATPSPTSLDFADQGVGTTSAEQTVTLTNLGSAPFDVTSVAASGDFNQGSNCTTLAMEGNCTVGVTFSPTATGIRTGELTFTDTACGNPYFIPLSGTGIDFTIAASPASATVTAGQTASYTATLTPVDVPFNQEISLSCSGLPLRSNCTFSPASVTPGANPATSTLTLTTTASSNTFPPMPSRWPGMPVYVFWLGLSALALLLVAGRMQRQKLSAWIPAATVLCLLLLLAACGGGSKAPQNPGTPKGAFTITVTGTAGSLTHTTTVTLVVQ